MKRRQLNSRKQRNAVRRQLAEAQQRAGKVKYALFAWLLGLPLPIIILALFFRGCDLYSRCWPRL
jgi:hypothetical protein